MASSGRFSFARRSPASLAVLTSVEKKKQIDDARKKTLAFKAKERVLKSMAEEETSDTSSASEQGLSEELALMGKKFKKLFKKNFPSKKQKEEKKRDHNKGTSGSKKTGKTYAAKTWSDTYSDDEDIISNAQLCLMAREDEKKQIKETNDSLIYAHDKLKEANEKVKLLNIVVQSAEIQIRSITEPSSSRMPPKAPELAALHDANVALKFLKSGADENLRSLILKAHKSLLMEQTIEGPRAQLDLGEHQPLGDDGNDGDQPPPDISDDDDIIIDQISEEGVQEQTTLTKVDAAESLTVDLAIGQAVEESAAEETTKDEGIKTTNEGHTVDIGMEPSTDKAAAERYAIEESVAETQVIIALGFEEQAAEGQAKFMPPSSFGLTATTVDQSSEAPTTQYQLSEHIHNNDTRMRLLETQFQAVQKKVFTELQSIRIAIEALPSNLNANKKGEK
ncbi:hypothetical protein AKJ16_DCAP26340 [Drosera capensis]